MFKKKRGLFVAVAISAWLGCPMTLLAGSEYELVCENKGCHYSGRVSFGGGRLFEKVTGCCVSNGQFVYLTWDREPIPKGNVRERVSNPRPSPVGYIWFAGTGQNVPLYQSKDCPQPFIPINSVEELKFCPKCGQPTLRSKLSLLFD